MKELLSKTFDQLVAVILLPALILYAFFCRYLPKKIDVGLGPEPLINNIYHKKALLIYGWTAETFVTNLYYITQDFDRKFLIKDEFRNRRFITRIVQLWSLLSAATYTLRTYHVVYIYFRGGIISQLPGFLWLFEPYCYALAGVKVVVMPYGSDVQVMSRSPNLLFKHVMTKDYPEHRKQNELIAKKITLWTVHADHVIAGVEWVDYMVYWDSLMLAHFSIEVPEKAPLYSDKDIGSVFRIVHAPNHREIKGTRYLMDAIEVLQSEGCNIELTLIERKSNAEVLEAIREADLVADQFVIGWYAMFALEAMSLAKPVLCYLRNDLISFYECANVVEKGEIPLINVSPIELIDAIRTLYNDRKKLQDVGLESFQFVKKYHSVEAVGGVFHQINQSIGLKRVSG